jgi:TonB-linked SusC/RagA family outer membrane protein
VHVRRSAQRFAVSALACLIVPATAIAQAGGGRVAGVVTDEGTKQPLVGVTVSIQKTSFAAVTDDQGRYLISNASPGVFNVEARRIGFGARQIDNIRIHRDSTVQLNIQMSSNPLRLGEVVVSATVDPTSGIKSPITIATLDGEKDLPVKPNMSAAGSIQGKVAGATILKASGSPGSGVYVQLRSPVSQFQSNSPLYVVDGVFLNSQQSVTTADIESMDIEKIEVIKGAAAASLYGSRAAGGVISITTNRGKNLTLGATQFQVRSEAGFNQFSRNLQKPSHHNFRINDAGQYVNATGVVVPRTQRVLEQDGIMDNPYSDPLYDQAAQFFRAGQFNTQNVSLTQNTASTNFNLAYNRYREEGVVLNSDGLTRQNIRVNLDHRIREVFSVGLSAFHNRSREDPSSVSFTDFYRFAPDVNLQAPGYNNDPYRVIPDSTDAARTNPLYRQIYNDNKTERMRTLVSSNLTYRPFSWLTFDGIASYDRGDRHESRYIPRGITGLDGETPTLGYIRYEDDEVDGFNAQAGATALRAFGPLTTRLTVRGESQREVNPYFSAASYDFTVNGVRDVDIGNSDTTNSSLSDRRANAGFVALAADYGGKYIGDFLVRREGSSLFGPENRWNTFYRASGAWLLSEEKWWMMPSLTSFKLRYSIGTAGTRPGFDDQYENLEVGQGGALSRQSFGNRRLRPEIAKEQELGLDAIIKNRISASLVYARLNSSGNIIGIPLPGIVGYNTQESNVGRITGNTIEATIQAQILNRPNGFQWEMNVVADRSRNKIVEFNRSCYTDGILNRCEGANLMTFWGDRHIKSVSELPAVHANSQGAFQRNDDGYLVPVGVGNSYRDGKTKNLWGTTVNIDGRSYAWGRPMWVVDNVGNRVYSQIGDGNPDAHFGVGNTFRWKGFSLYGLVTGQLGGDIYNNIRQGTYASGDHEDLDQFGRPEELKKPASYYTVGLADQNNDYNDEFVEDGTYAKLSELSLRYNLRASQLGLLKRFGADRASIDFIGRNVFTVTKYSGLDPENGSVLTRVEDNVYPQVRTWTMAFNVSF